MYQRSLPTGYSFEYNRWVFRCENPKCYYARSVAAEGADVQHVCPQVNGQTKVAWVSYGPSLLQQTWAELDRVTAEIIEFGPNPPDYAPRQIGYAQGLAWTLSLFMMPHFKTPQDIAREAKKRYQERQAGNTEYETPGLGSRKYEAPPGDNKYSTESAAKKKILASMAPKPTEPALSEDQIAAIRNAAPMFEAKDLAAMYKVSVKTIEKLLV